ncbi:hypothetical protein A7C99_1175 [Trichophyton rubrum]|uniref:Uncharacterized protein n=1 Tax=Trichophyton rubrum TaxID=5551 RepID=A0A178F4P3_TRIRU|nr:hypothetical protein A7C99_1175 [Trichophyton rubrum]
MSSDRGGRLLVSFWSTDERQLSESNYLAREQAQGWLASGLLELRRRRGRAFSCLRAGLAGEDEPNRAGRSRQRQRQRQRQPAAVEAGDRRRSDEAVYDCPVRPARTLWQRKREKGEEDGRRKA